MLCGSLKNHYYIGKHSTTRPQDKYYGSGSILKDYYKKYGKKDGVTFIKEILEYNSSSEENLERERVIIGDKWKTDSLCINLCEGGRGPFGIVISEETRQKLRDSHKGKPSPKKGQPSPNNCKPCKEETKAKISKANSGENNGMYGKTPWNKGKKMEYSTGANNYQAKPIEQYTLDGEYIKTWPCIADARRELNLGRTGITKNLCGDRKTAYGYIWKYAA